MKDTYEKNITLVWDPGTCTFSKKCFDVPLLVLQKNELATVMCMLRSTCQSHTVDSTTLQGENIVAGFVHPETEEFFLVHEKCIHEYELVGYEKGAQRYIAYELEPFSFSITKRCDIFYLSFSFLGHDKVWSLKCPVRGVLPLCVTAGFGIVFWNGKRNG